MTAAGSTLSVYDGQTRLGTIHIDHDHGVTTYRATLATGRECGSFKTLSEAGRAISQCFPLPAGLRDGG